MQFSTNKYSLYCFVLFFYEYLKCGSSVPMVLKQIPVPMFLKKNPRRFCSATKNQIFGSDISYINTIDSF